MDKWDKRFMNIADEVATWSSCLKRHVGCVITKDRRIVATGYNGAPSGIPSCAERNECLREKCMSAEDLFNCWATHAEQNALLQAARLGISIQDGTLYTTTEPCSLCAKLIINSGIKRVVYKEEYPDKFARKLLTLSKIEVVKL